VDTGYGTQGKPLNFQKIQWEYEDELPEMEDDVFDAIYTASRIVWGVRMYPYVEDENGQRIYLAEQDDPPPIRVHPCSSVVKKRLKHPPTRIP
jgi:hypothetical protein